MATHGEYNIMKQGQMGEGHNCNPKILGKRLACSCEPKSGLAPTPGQISAHVILTANPELPTPPTPFAKPELPTMTMRPEVRALGAYHHQELCTVTHSGTFCRQLVKYLMFLTLIWSNPVGYVIRSPYNKGLAIIGTYTSTSNHAECKCQQEADIKLPLQWQGRDCVWEKSHPHTTSMYQHCKTHNPPLTFGGPAPQGWPHVPWHTMAFNRT